MLKDSKGFKSTGTWLQTGGRGQHGLEQHVEKVHHVWLRSMIFKAPRCQGVKQGKPIYAKGEDERKLVENSPITVQSDPTRDM